MKKIFTLALLMCMGGAASAQVVYHPLAVSPFMQDWSNIALISVNDNWTTVPSIIGYRGDNVTTATGASPDTLLGEGTITVDVNANQTAPNTYTTGGVTEFEIANPTIALSGSGTADAPYITIHLNTTGRYGINFSFVARDIDGSNDTATQRIAVQYRIGNTGPFINIPEGFIADATQDSAAGLETPVSFILPAGAENQPEVQIRIITSNAFGNDEWVGIDNIVVTQGSATAPLSLTSFDAKANNQTVILAWKTSQEENVSHFEVEKSINSMDFRKIGQVTATNNASGSTYGYTDETASNVAYYRLKMIDKDGKYNYSKVIRVNMRGDNRLDIYPNPVVDRTVVSYEKATKGATVEIFTMNGKRVMSQVVDAGSVQTELSLGKLAKGTYIVVMVNGNERTTSKIVKL